MTTALGAIVPVTVGSVDAVAAPWSVVTVTLMVVVPGDSASAAPDAGSIDATLGSLLVQAAEATGTICAPLVADAARVSDAPGSSDGVRGAMAAVSTAAGGSVEVLLLRGVGAP